MILDSGAFSAWTKKVNISLDEYIQFIKRYEKNIDHSVNLDVIPGAFGRIPSFDEVEESASKSWENMLYMESKGVKPIPVFHMGENFKWLHKMIEHGCDYVGISPANDRTTAEKVVWLDEVFEAITDDKGLPVIKTHGFGVTAVPLLFRYPWYSADSTSWILCGAFGNILIPKMVGNYFVYDQVPHVVSISSGKSKKAMEGSKNFDLFGNSTKKHIVDYIYFCGTSLEEVRTSCLARSQVCAVFFRELSKNYVSKPFKRKRYGLL